MPEPKDHGHRVAAQRTLDTYNRARGGFHDRETTLIYLLATMEIDWTRLRDKWIKEGTKPDLIPTYEQLTRAASRIAKQDLT